MLWKGKAALAASIVTCLLSAPGWSQGVDKTEIAEPVATQLSDEATPHRIFSDAEIAVVPMPVLSFEETDRIRGDYDKYFYFYRPDTSFSEAYADITECDQLSSGISYYVRDNEPYPGYYATQYGAGGAIGAVLGSVFSDLLNGSATRRKVRRINMRNCMGFKGYQRFGLEKSLWQVFNFEEGNGRKRDDLREAALLQQARVASGPPPSTKELGL